MDDIDVFYYSDYAPNCDDGLINYCSQEKPQVVLLSLQNIAIRKGGAPTPDAVWKITHQLRMPTVMFWFDIDGDAVAEILERYRHSVTLNMILGADASSHKALPLQMTNYVYAGFTFDEHLFDIPEGVRDIPVGFLGSLKRNRSQWIAGLRKFGISPYIAGGCTDWVSPAPGWIPYEGYLKLMSRLKIGLNFSSKANPVYPPVITPNRERVPKVPSLPLSWLKTSYSELNYIISSWKKPIPAVKHIISVLNDRALPLKPKYTVMGRVWEALWCRTFLLEEDNPVTSLYFEPYVDYVPFTTLKDLADKIRYYLEHEEERDRIRMHGRATVEKYHNARIYWENLFDTIGLQSATQHDHHPGEFWNKAYFDNWYLSHPSMER
ncbi:MAG: glycosyltransferase family 1 protein [Desulfobacteraceae bacterium]|nr:glycosyltransferase family 1 protein [Desulfobacteraceae bacterium]